MTREADVEKKKKKLNPDLDLFLLSPPPPPKNNQQQGRRRPGPRPRRRPHGPRHRRAHRHLCQDRPSLRPGREEVHRHRRRRRRRGLPRRGRGGAVQPLWRRLPRCERGSPLSFFEFFDFGLRLQKTACVCVWGGGGWGRKALCSDTSHTPTTLEKKNSQSNKNSESRRPRRAADPRAHRHARDHRGRGSR